MVTTRAALRAASTADGRTGLTLDRYFTTQGVHPYDDLEWERRDAVITDYQTGEVSFEQRNVEFPASWSMNATTIVAQKYFRGHLGTPGREHSVRHMIDRVADTITQWGTEGGYFADADSAEVFNHELKHLLVTQKAAFNSPVWFNVGVEDKPQCSACFILSVEDQMTSILNWYYEEGIIFKGGSGSGVNLSRIRSSQEKLKGGGEASGPVSFMRGADASAGTIKSGGKTRRAAKMVILDSDHPDIEEFIWCKRDEEQKVRALEAAGYDMSFDSQAMSTVQYQNANNSVRVDDDFMRAVEHDEEYQLIGRTDGEVKKTVRARELFRQIARAAWECADPGLQYDTTINHWHTTPNAGRINGSNPCFTGDSLVHTDKGLIPFAELMRRVADGEGFGVYTHDVTNPDAPAERMEITAPDAFMITGRNPIVRLRLSNGMELRCTPGHKIYTTNRGYVAAEGLNGEDRVKILNLPSPAVSAEQSLPVDTDPKSYQGKGEARRSVRLPEKWSSELAEYLGWLVGDGSISGDVVATIYGGEEEQHHILPRHQEVATWMNEDRTSTPSVQPNGTVQLRQSRRAIRRFLEALGVCSGKAAEKVVPWSVMQAPPQAAAAFLRGLFDADGCVHDGAKTRYVGLGTRSSKLAQDVQRLLSTFGIASTIYRQQVSDDPSFVYERKDGSTATYGSHGVTHDVRISGPSVERFARAVGFSLPSKADGLAKVLDEHARYSVDETASLVERYEDGVELTYNLSEPRNHSYVVNGICVRNCSEYMHLDNSACNLASLNLRKFEYDGVFDTEAFTRAVEIIFTAQEIIVGNSSYPTDKIAENAKAYRQLGLGYANLGGLLMSQGIAYDSDEGRAWAGAVTALMTGHAYRTSAELAKAQGPFAGFHQDREGTLAVLRQHRDALADIDEGRVPTNILDAARRSWEEAVELGTEHGVRNAQASVLAPTGCLVGGSLVPTERGLVRLSSLGDAAGSRWQGLDVDVATDDGTRQASHFYVNGAESVVTVDTTHGHRVQGTPAHRIKVVEADGSWEWKRFGDLQAGDSVPLAMNTLVGQPQTVPLPPLGEGHGTGDRHVVAPRSMTPELAELVGYVIGDGSLHAQGLRLGVADGDFEVIERLTQLSKQLFNLEAQTSQQPGCTEVALGSVRLAQWWEAAGLAEQVPSEGPRGQGWRPHIPEAVLHANDRSVYAAFLRGLFEAEGAVTVGHPEWATSSLALSHDVQSLLLALGYPTTRRFHPSGRGSQLAVLRLLNAGYHQRWLDEIGFLSDRKTAAVAVEERAQPARSDRIPVTRRLIDRVAPDDGRIRQAMLMEHRRHGRASRRIATEAYEASGDPELGHLLGFFYDEIHAAELGEDELTYDVSVPDNTTYVANGFISHNTIGLMMDCDTTGVEPDLGLVKMKKLVGGGTMRIINHTVPEALKKLGYQPEQVEAIVDYIDKHSTIEGAPGLRDEHLPVFDCAIGERSIAPRGHVHMMGAVQPWISGAISKCVTGETIVPTEDGLVRIGDLHRGEGPDTFRSDVRRIASLGEEAKTDSFYYGGTRPVSRVTLRSGHTVTGTENHRLLVADDQGLSWRFIDDLEPGDQVAVQYGADLWAATAARLDDFVPSRLYGCQKRVRVPEEMSEDLAFLLGAYCSEGSIAHSTWTVAFSNADDGVLQRIAETIRSVFAVEPRINRPSDRCASVTIASKTIVELIEHLGCGASAANKRIPASVLRSPRDMVLAFLQGLFLDAYASTAANNPKLALCVRSPQLLDDYQAVLTNLGIVHGRISKYNPEYAQTYDEVYASGSQAGQLAALAPFVESEKARRAVDLPTHSSPQGSSDVVPGVSGRELYDLIPAGRAGGENGQVESVTWRFLLDPRTDRVSRETLERVAAIPGVELPGWLQRVLDDGLHFAEVTSVEDGGVREVYDLSVPATHAFVGNGIVNHNTVNMPESATVEDVEEMYFEGWKLGLKAIAIYRDNCKVAQPLAVASSKSGEADVEPATTTQQAEQQGMVRRRLPKQRPSQTLSFTVGDAEGYLTAGEYPGDGLGEIFVKLGKQGSTLSGVMDAFAIAVSLGLQYGVPLEAYVKKFVNTRFEPSGITDDREVKFASSLIDYIFRRLAIEYLPPETRQDIGIYTIAERNAQLEGGYGASGEAQRHEPVADAEGQTMLPVDKPTHVNDVYGDAPMCVTCGVQMVRAGSCHLCQSCGATSGCS